MGALLAQAFERCAMDPARAPSIHGFHTYPARMHPLAAEVLVRGFSAPGARVLDPFCGGGTVLVEALRAGCEVAGTDLSPLAVRLARVRSDPGSEGMRRELVVVGEAVAATVRAGDAPRFRIPRREVGWYAPHVLAELSALRGAIAGVRHGWVRERLLFVLSSLVVKASRQRSETVARRVSKTIARGAVTRWFVERTRSLAGALAELERDLGGRRGAGTVAVADARTADEVVGRRSIDLVLTSPPYGGTYDYALHHARRGPWLGIDFDRLARGEIGARRDGARTDRATFDAQVEAYLRAAARTLVPGGRVVLLVGDGRWAGEMIEARAQIERLGAGAGLALRAAARQPRRDPSGGPRRFEWLLVLERDGA